LTSAWHVSADLADDVSVEEYARLLGLPPKRVLDGEIGHLMTSSREWYRTRGRPWVSACRVRVDALEGDDVLLESGSNLRSPALASRLRRYDSQQIAVLAVSAGPEVDVESAALWSHDRPDAAYFLDRLGAAIAELLVRWAGREICRAAESERLTALPPIGPGCSDWDFDDQHRLFALLGASTGPLQMLPSGMMTPKNSMLAVSVLTSHAFAAAPRDACRSCDLSPCAFRRAPFDRAAARRPGAEVTS